MNAIFDYSDKSTEWIRKLIAKSGMFNEWLRDRVLASARKELEKRGETK